MTTAPFLVAGDPTATGAISSSRSPSTGTLTVPTGGWRAGDLILLGINILGSGPTVTYPPGWFDMGTTMIGAGNGISSFGHWITVDEAAAGTTSWTLTNLFAANATGRRLVSVWRSVNLLNPKGNWSQNTTSGSVLSIPNLTPAYDGSTVVCIGGVTLRTSAQTITAPTAPWSTDLGSTLSTGSTTTTAIGYQNSTTTTAGVAVSGQTLALSASDTGVAVAIELRAAADNAGAFFGMF